MRDSVVPATWAFLGHLGVVEVLVSRGAFVNAEDRDGNTPLLLAVIEAGIGSHEAK